VFPRELGHVGVFYPREVGADVGGCLWEEVGGGGDGEDGRGEPADGEGTGTGEDGSGQAGYEDVDGPGDEGFI
jgi:hypothetical protein